MRASCKERVLAVERILQNKKKATKREIMTDLDRLYGITCDTKSFYDDINTLTLFMPIDVEYRGCVSYYVLGGGES